MKKLLLVILLLIASGTAASAELTVFAASSLREPFIAIGELFEKRHGEEVVFNFAGSQTLKTQIEFGAPADLYAAANPMIIRPLVEKGLVGDVRYFAGNRLVLLLAGNRPPLRQLSELTADNLQIALGNSAVPIGQYTLRLLENLAGDPAFGAELVAGIRRNVRTEESSVKAIVAKVLLGEVDAGFVYASDLVDGVRAKTAHLELPAAHNPFVRYPAAVVSGSQHATAAQRFLDLLLAPAGQQILHRHGFLPAGSGDDR